MRLKQIELRTIRLQLQAAFRSSRESMQTREVLLLCVEMEDGSAGWSECVALPAPFYSPEYLDGCAAVMERFLAPLLFATPISAPEDVAGLLAPVRGHRMAKAALEAGILDAFLRREGRSLGNYLGGTRSQVVCGVSIGISNSLDELLQEVDDFVRQGYPRVKLKIQPGWDLEPVAKVRESWPSLLLQVDANQAYSPADTKHLSKLDAFELLLIEQPFDEEDWAGHARLTRQLKTPICLDESIVSRRSAETAISMGAADIISIKAGRVGGILEARAIHDFCQEQDIPVWCGGMLETGIGRAANLALASLPGFTLPADISASERYFREEPVPPLTIEEGLINVPTGPGIGLEPDLEKLKAMTVTKKVLQR